jgi:hypothetical protein
MTHATRALQRVSVFKNPHELADFEERTFRQWDPASLSGLRGAIVNRRRQLGG